MSRGKWLTVVAVFAVVAAACGSDSPSSLSLEAYAAEMQAIETEFETDAPDLSQQDARVEYPRGGDLVAATELYTAIDNRLADWQSLTAPPAVSALHAQLVEALDALQEKVGDYLMDGAFEGEDFDFDGLGPKVDSLVLTAAAACRDLRSALQDAGTVVVFAADCEF